MNAADSLPADVGDRIVRAHTALAAVRRLKSADQCRYWRAVAAARHRLADAYKAAWEIAPHGTVLSVILLDGYSTHRYGAVDDEYRAQQIRRVGRPTKVGVR